MIRIFRGIVGVSYDKDLLGDSRGPYDKDLVGDGRGFQ